MYEINILIHDIIIILCINNTVIYIYLEIKIKHIINKNEINKVAT